MKEGAKKARQRERLLKGMLAGVARDGYNSVSVATVLKQARVSRATFYDYFSDRDDCLLAVHADLAARLTEAVERIEGPAAREPARDALLALLAAADENPAAARLLTVDAFGATRAVRRQQEELLVDLEGAAERLLSESPGLEKVGLPQAALVGGIGAVIATRAFRGESGRLASLADDLLSWVSSYAMPAGHEPPGEEEWVALGKEALRRAKIPPKAKLRSRKLPRGRSAIDPADAAAAQHRRIVAAVAHLCRTKGFAAITVAELAAAAGISRKAFYERFRNKEDAALVALAMVTQDSLQTVATEFFQGEEWPDRVWRGLGTLLDYMAHHEDLFALGMVEISAIGPQASARILDARMSYTLFFEDGYRYRPEAEGQPRVCSQAVGGAVYEMSRRQYSRGRTRQMLEILPQLAFVGLAPFTGPIEALETIRARTDGGG